MAMLLFAAGVVVGSVTTDSDGTNLVKDAITTPFGSENNTTGSDTSSTAAADNGSAVAFTISIADLPETQKAFLRTMGVTGDTIPVTNEMLACAEASVSAERINEIKNGAVPTVTEGVKLAGCY